MDTWQKRNIDQQLIVLPYRNAIIAIVSGYRQSWFRIRCGIEKPFNIFISDCSA